MTPAPLRAPGEWAPTPMERHAALGPIAWTDGGMRATTRDGYAVEINPSLFRPSWVVTFKEPDGDGGWVHILVNHPNPTAARVEVAHLITGLRRLNARAADREGR